MARVPSIIPVSDLRQGAAGVLSQVRKSKQPVFITQRGRATAVVMSVEVYEDQEKERELLRRIAQGEREVAAGDLHDFADVMADARSLLRR